MREKIFLLLGGAVLGQIHLSEYLMFWQLFNFFNFGCLWVNYAILRFVNVFVAKFDLFFGGDYIRLQYN